MRVRYSPRAVIDLENIRLHISMDNPPSAWVVASFIRHVVARLVQWPRSGRMTDVPGVRRQPIVHYPYVVYYQAKGDEIVSLSVLHSAQEKSY